MVERKPAEHEANGAEVPGEQVRLVDRLRGAKRGEGRVLVAIHSSGLVEVYKTGTAAVKVVELEPGEDAIDAAEGLPKVWRDMVWPCTLKASGVNKRSATDGVNVLLLQEMRAVVAKHGRQHPLVWSRLSDYATVLGVRMVDVLDGLKQLVKEDAAKK